MNATVMRHKSDNDDIHVSGVENLNRKSEVPGRERSFLAEKAASIEVGSNKRTATWKIMFSRGLGLQDGTSSSGKISLSS